MDIRKKMMSSFLFIELKIIAKRMRLPESISNISKDFDITWYLHIPTKIS